MEWQLPPDTKQITSQTSYLTENILQVLHTSFMYEFMYGIYEYYTVNTRIYVNLVTDTITGFQVVSNMRESLF